MRFSRETYEGVLGTVEEARKHMRDAKIAVIREDWDKTPSNTIAERE